MNSNVLNTIYLALAYLLLFASAEILYHKYKIRADITRKYVHVVTGLLTMLFPILIGNHWLVLTLCGSFFIILLFSMKFDLLPSINRIKRQTLGSIFYPVIVFLCYMIYEQKVYHLIYFYLPVLTLAFCDPVAEYVGKTYKWGKYQIHGHTKTLIGSTGFFVSSFVLSLILIIYLSNIGFVSALPFVLCIAFTTTLAEALAQKGYDNLTIPAIAVLNLLYFNL